jgi:hypothetical protein
MAYVDGYGGGTNHGDAGVNFESTEMNPRLLATADIHQKHGYCSN